MSRRLSVDRRFYQPPIPDNARFSQARLQPEPRLILGLDLLPTAELATPQMLRAVSQFVKNSEQFGPYGKVFALVALAVLATGCSVGAAGITPTATSHELPSLTPTGTPSPTASVTETLAPTHTSTPTPGLRVFPVSAYEGGDNQIGINVGGAAQAVFTRLTDHLTSAWEQLARYGDSAKHQDYAADMLFSPVKDKLTSQRGPDFWEKYGGLGFNPDNYNGYDGVQPVLNANPEEFFKLGGDGIYRAIVKIQEEEDFEFALAASARAKFQLLYPDSDFTSPEVLRAFDDLIRAEVQSAIRENGFRPKTNEPWPGAKKIFGFESGSFVDGEGKVCIGERPPGSDNLRSTQRPEKLPENEYIRGLENHTPGNDEAPDRLDTRGSVMVTMAFDPNRRLLRTDIFSLSSPPDPQRVEAESLDNETVNERLEVGRWNPCGLGAAPAPEASQTPVATPLGGPAITETVAPPPVTPVETPRPGATPALTDTPRPPEPTQPTQPPPTELPLPTDAPTQPPQATATAGNPLETPNPSTPEPTSAPAETQPGPEPTTIPVAETSTPSR